MIAALLTLHEHLERRAPNLDITQIGLQPSLTGGNAVARVFCTPETFRVTFAGERVRCEQAHVKGRLKLTYTLALGAALDIYCITLVDFEQQLPSSAVVHGGAIDFRHEAASLVDNLSQEDIDEINAEAASDYAAWAKDRGV